jgi:hypothetical protein
VSPSAVCGRATAGLSRDPRRHGPVQRRFLEKRAPAGDNGAMASWVLLTPGGEVPIEQVCVIGRSSDCEVPIDDPNASRRHASLRLVGADVVVEDLQSRNGTFVDGRLIGSPTIVSGPARIIIGHTVMTLARGSNAPHRRSGRTPGTQLPAAEAMHTNTAVPDQAMLDRALAMFQAGHIDECAGGAAILVRRQSGLGVRAQEEHVRGVSALLVALSERTGDPRWLEGVFQVNTDCDRVIAPELVDAIERLLTPGLAKLLPTYVAKLGARGTSLSQAERVLLARLARLVA